MIIYGWKSSHIAQEDTIDGCPECRQAFTTKLHVFQKYAHVFWIPMFPLGRDVKSQCSHCKMLRSNNELSQSQLLAYANMKKRIPVWMFSGLFLIAALAVWITINSNIQNKENAEFLLHAKSGDIYEIKLGYKSYTTYQVEEVKGDSVFVRMNEYETNRSSGIKDIKYGDYSAEIYSYHTSELQKMLEDGDIIDIERE